MRALALRRCPGVICFTIACPPFCCFLSADKSSVYFLGRLSRISKRLEIRRKIKLFPRLWNCGIMENRERHYAFGS